MEIRNVSDDTLNKLLAQTYNWHTLPPSLVYGMAVELSKARFLLQRQHAFIGDLLAAQEVENEIRTRVTGGN